MKNLKIEKKLDKNDNIELFGHLVFMFWNVLIHLRKIINTLRSIFVPNLPFFVHAIFWNFGEMKYVRFKNCSCRANGDANDGANKAFGKNILIPKCLEQTICNFSISTFCLSAFGVRTKINPISIVPLFLLRGDAFPTTLLTWITHWFFIDIGSLLAWM